MLCPPRRANARAEADSARTPCDLPRSWRASADRDRGKVENASELSSRMRRAGEIVLGHRRGQRTSRHPVGFDLQRDAKICAAMSLQPNAPQRVRAEVAHTETDDAVPTPLTHVDLLVPEEVRRVLAAFAHDHRGPDGDAARAPRNRTTDPESVAVTTLEGHVRDPSSSPQRSASYLRRALTHGGAVGERDLDLLS